MNQKLRITILAITIGLLLFGGWTAYASSSSGAQVSTAIQGTFKSVDSTNTKVTVTTDSGDQTVTLAKSVWVYRNEQKAQLSDLKTGDKIELILNNKQQAAYVKAASEGAAVVEPKPTVQASPMPTPMASPSTASGNGASTGGLPKVPSAPATSTPSQVPTLQVNEVYPGLDGIDLKIDGKHFKLHIQQASGGDGNPKYDLNIKPDGSGMVHLKGDEAAAWIRMLLATVDLKSSNAEQQILAELADHYGLEASKLNIQMKSNWKQVSPSPKQKDDDEKDAAKDEDKDQGASQKNEPNNDHNNHDKKTEKQEQHKKNDKQHGNKHDD